MTPIARKFEALGGAGGPLGAPAGGETPCADGVGRMQSFAGGVIFWHPSLGAYEVHGDIGALWRALGREAGSLGYPLSDELPADDGHWRFSLFQAGAIHWSPETGPFVVPQRVGHDLSFFAIPQLDSIRKGIHLVWHGIPSWMSSPHGFWIQRRRFKPAQAELTCVTLDAPTLARARAEGELEVAIGRVTARSSAGPIDVVRGTPVSDGEWHVYTLELDRPRRLVRLTVTGVPGLAAPAPPPAVFAFPVRHGRVAGAPKTDLVQSHEAPAIDALAVYCQREQAVELCVRAGADVETGADWMTVPYIVRGLQLPVHALLARQDAGDDPPPPSDPVTRAQQRLLDEERLPPEDFDRVAECLRTAASLGHEPRPGDRIYETRGRTEDKTAGVTESQVAIGPLGVLMTSPRWRRALGLSHFDRSPDLEPGETYEYRLTAFYPVEDLEPSRVYAFSSVPAGTQLPLEFYLGDVRVGTPEPRVVSVHRFTSDDGAVYARRGLTLAPRRAIVWPWDLDGDLLAGLTLVLEFPRPVSDVILELAPDHKLRYAGDAEPVPLPPSTPVPSGPRAALHFASPTRMIRVSGGGTLFAVRLPAGSPAWVPVTSMISGVRFADTPLPAPPLDVRIDNLQTPVAEPTADTPLGRPQPRAPLGFAIDWTPVLAGGGAVWPSDAPPPPLESAVYQIEHRSTDPASGWTPLLSGENLTFGQRRSRPPDTPETNVRHGADLLALYPESRAPGPGGRLHASDPFDSPDGPRDPAATPRPVPPTGTRHQYRVRAVDAIGRPGAAARESNVARLEKHLPPPLPAALDADWPAPTPRREARPTGVVARVFVRGAPDFAELAARADWSEEERRAIAGAANAIVLEWGWHAQQREIDPAAREFRVYVSSPLNRGAATITRVDSVSPGVYRTELALERAIEPGAALGLTVETPYPMHVDHHTSGPRIVAQLSCAVPLSDGTFAAPRAGAIVLPLHWSPGATRPRAWRDRISRIPIATASRYRALIVDRLRLTPDHPNDEIWVGVSAADAEPYVPDSRVADPIGVPGNESDVVALVCTGRYALRPALSTVAAIADVSEVVTPEPSSGRALVTLDLRPALTRVPEIASAPKFRPERAGEPDIVRAYRYDAAANTLFARTPLRERGEPPEAPAGFWPALAPADQRAIASAYRGESALPNRHLVFLAAAHRHADRLFAPAVAEPIAVGPFEQSLAYDAGRQVYRARLADAAGHLSDGAAVAALVVRVPDLSPAPAPDRERLESSADAVVLVLRVAPDPLVTHVLVFARAAGPATTPEGQRPASLLRLPNRRDLIPTRLGDLIRVWAHGDVLAPTVKSLADADVRDGELDDHRYVSVPIAARRGATLLLWACAVTRDGVPSPLIGPFRAMTAPGGEA